MKKELKYKIRRLGVIILGQAMFAGLTIAMAITGGIFVIG